MSLIRVIGRTAFATSLSVFFVIVGLVVAGVFLYLVPAIGYHIRGRALRAACESIKPGMNKSTALKILDHTVEPRSEGITGDELHFATDDVSCMVQLEPDGDTVKTAQSNEIRHAPRDSSSGDWWPESRPGR